MPPPWASFVPAVLCLGFYTAARVAEQVRAGIQSLPRGQNMAGTAMGLTTWRRPIATCCCRWRSASSCRRSRREFLNIIKNSVGRADHRPARAHRRARARCRSSRFQVFEAFTAATILYILINIVVVLGMRWLEKRVSVPGFDRRRVPPQAGH